MILGLFRDNGKENGSYDDGLQGSKKLMAPGGSSLKSWNPQSHGVLYP